MYLLMPTQHNLRLPQVLGTSSPTLGLSVRVRPQEPHNLGFAPGYSRS